MPICSASGRWGLEMTSKMKQIREQRGLGQKEVAARLNMPVRTYGSYERGERTLSLDIAAQIADVFEVTIDELMNREYTTPVITLNWEERTLVRLYRNMSEAQKNALMEVARSIAIGNEKSGEGNPRDEELAGRSVM